MKAINKGLWLRVEIDRNLEKMANFFKLIPCVVEKSPNSNCSFVLSSKNHLVFSSWCYKAFCVRVKVVRQLFSRV